MSLKYEPSSELQVRARCGVGDGGGVGDRGCFLPPLLPRTDPWVFFPPFTSFFFFILLKPRVE